MWQLQKKNGVTIAASAVGTTDETGAAGDNTNFQSYYFYIVTINYMQTYTIDQISLLPMMADNYQCIP